MARIGVVGIPDQGSGARKGELTQKPSSLLKFSLPSGVMPSRTVVHGRSLAFTYTGS